MELLPGLFSFTFSLPPFFICSFFFLSFCLAFVRRVHFYGKGLGKTLRIIELPRLKIFIETFGSTLCQFFSGLFDWIILIQVVSPCTTLTSKLFMTVSTDGIMSGTIDVNHTGGYRWFRVKWVNTCNWTCFTRYLFYFYIIFHVVSARRC